MRLLRGAAFGICALAIIALASPLLFWLGRGAAPRDPIDSDIDPDDPGVDVDDEALS